MQGEGFVLPGRDRVPSIFGATALFFFAVIGKELTGYIVDGARLFLSLFVYNIPESFHSAAYSFVYYFFFIILPLSVYAGRHPGIGEYIRVHRVRSKISLLCVLAAVPLVYFSSYVTSFWYLLITAFGGSIEGPVQTIPQTTGQLLGALLTDALLPGVCEELLFRGALLSAWEVKGSKKAIVIVTVLFMLIHGSVTGMVSEVIGGIVMGIVAVSTESIFPGMLIHAVYNGFITVIRYIGRNDVEAEAYPQLTYFEQLGGMGGVIALLMKTLIAGAILVLILKRVDSFRQGRPFGVKAVEGEPRSIRTTVILTCSVIAALVMYGYDFNYVLGWVKP